MRLATEQHSLTNATPLVFLRHLSRGVHISTMATTVDAKLLRATKFPPEFNQKVDMQKVNLDLMKK